MRAVVRAAVLLVACVYLAGCQGGDEVRTGDESISLRIPLTGDVCGVVSATASVSAADMGTIGPVALEVADTAIQGRISTVPAGRGRTVLVTAYNAARLEVYSGSTVVDVLAGNVVTANLTLYRNTQNCSGVTTGDIDIIGTIDTGTPPPDAGTDGGTPSDGGVVLEGPQFAFTFTDATLTTNGVIHFLDDTGNQVRRLDLTTRSFKPALVGTADTTAMAVSPDGQAAYLAYAGGRMDAFNTVDGTTRFFAAAPETVSSMVVTKDYLFTIDGSGAWDTQALYQRSTGARVSSVDWRYSSRSMVFSPLNNRVYFLNSGVSPTDVVMVELDLATGKVGVETGSPYHGDYSLPNPIRLLPDESGVVVGSGLIFNTRDLTYRTSMGLTFQDIAFHNGRLYLLDTVGGMTQLRVLSSTFDILSAQYVPGTAKRLFVHGGQLVIITETTAGLRVILLPV